jgi:2-aminoadipate transaminase
VKEATDIVLSERGGEALNYGNGQGVEELRGLIAERMSTDKVKVDPDNVVITSGSQQGLDLIGRTLLNDGDRVLVRNPTYIGSLMAWKTYQLDYGSVFSGDDDLDAAMQPRPKLMYFVTDFENPTGEMMSLERRQKLVNALGKYQVPVVEDDPYGQLRYDGEPIPTLFELDAENAGHGGIGGHVIYAGSFSKVLSPGLRIGWLVADKAFVTKLMLIKQGANLCSSIFDQFVAYEASRDGFLDENILKLRVWYKERRDAMIAAMEKHFPPGVTFTRPKGGFFIMVTLPEGMDTIDLLKIAVERGVVFIPGESFHIREGGNNTLRLSFSRYTPDLIDEGIRRLADSIKDMMAERV